SSISGNASRGSFRPVGACVTGIFDLTSFHRLSISRPNFSSRRARSTWSRTNRLYFSTVSTTCPSLLISFVSVFVKAFLSNACSSIRYLAQSPQHRCQKLARTVDPRQDHGGVSPRYQTTAGLAGFVPGAVRFQCEPRGPVADRSC